MISRHVLFLLLLFFVFHKAVCQGREEFNGPFNDWANVRTRFGAKGDGRSDDTKAIQQALDSLTNPVSQFNTGANAYMVVYLPAGTYCISSTLALKGKIGVSIIGEDPTRTIIKWIGKAADTMLWANASAYFKISRLGWDVNGRKEMEGIGIHWKDRWKEGRSQSFAPLNIELSDNYFIGRFRNGISGGTFGGEGTGANDSEVTIRRCKFTGCTNAGIEIHGYNALDYWIWDCSFTDCYIGVKCSMGNYHVYRSYFSGSAFCDLRNQNCHYTSVRGCYSRGSNGFSTDDGISCNPFKRIFQDNTVVNVRQYPIEYYHLGKLTLWDNRFDQVKDTAVFYWANTGSWCQGIYEIMSINNRYGAREPLRNNRWPMINYTMNDKARQQIVDNYQAFLQTMDVTPVMKSRKVFEVPLGASSGQIQSIIDRACASGSERAIVHFGTGSYRIDNPLQVAAGSDITLCGDGLSYATMILKTNAKNFIGRPMLLVEGPTAVCLRDMQWGSPSNPDPTAAIQFVNVDQQLGQVHIDQLDCRADTSLLVDRMNYLYVEKDNSFFSTGNYVIGGAKMRDGKGTAGLYCFGGQYAGAGVRENAVFMAKDCWWEGAMPLPLDLSGWGTISIDGALAAPVKQDSTPTIRIHDFKGSISLMNMYMQGAISPDSRSSDLRLLVWNVLLYHKMNVLDFVKPGLRYQAAFLGLNAQCFDTKNADCKTIISIPDKTLNTGNTMAFTEEMTRLTRKSKPVPYRTLPRGISNIHITRVSIGAMGKGLIFSP